MPHTHAHPAKKQRQQLAAQHPGAGFIWLLGFIGAFVYYLEQVDTFAGGIVAFLKAVFWPAFLVYKLLS